MTAGRWDFVADTFGASRRLRILAINDDAYCENLCLLGDTSISGLRVARQLDRLVACMANPLALSAITSWSGSSGGISLASWPNERSNRPR